MALRDFLAPLGHAHDKRVPEIVHGWTPQLFGTFLEAFIDGDGTTHRRNGHRVMYTASAGLADDLQTLATKAGVSANLRIDDRTGLERVMPSGQRFRNLRPSYVVSLVTRRNRPLVNHGRSQPSRYWNAQGFNDGLVDYAGGVHSAVVPNGLLLVRRRGKPVVAGA